MAGTSPPGPLRCGSTTCKVKAVGIPASKALPPFSKVAMPTAVAIQWLVATTPKVPSISGRVVNGLGLMLLIEVPAVRARCRKVGTGFRKTSCFSNSPKRDGDSRISRPALGGPLHHRSPARPTSRFPQVPGAEPGELDEDLA